jgi:DNA repair protein RecN (Recombination protein N)
MLVELSIRDLALIEEADVAFGPGLNVASGETGAGKTLLVTSLELLLGLTPKGGLAGLVRTGAEEARVEGRFALEDGELRRRVAERLAAELPELELEDELILGRRVGADGRSRAHVDQRPVPVRALRALAPILLEIHGQNEHQKLLEPAEQLRLWDAFAGVTGVLESYREARAGWLALRREAQRVRAEADERRERIELLRFQRAELEGARLRAGEHAELATERGILRRAGELRTALGRWSATLCEAEPALRDTLCAAEGELERWTSVLATLEPVLEDVRAARVHVEEAGAALRSRLEQVVDDPPRLEEVEERLAELERLQAKYRSDEAGLLARVEAIAAELALLEREEAGADELDASEAQAREALMAAAARLGDKRRATAKKLAKTVESVLAELGLERARFEPVLAPSEGDDEERFGPRGAESAEFRLAANPGEEPRPLRLVASGGETARIMLALRTVLSAGGGGRTLVFDEIDAGVGGRLGPQVGAHLRRLAERQQVLCVTHLPAIAAQARSHLKVSKASSAGRTRTSIAALDGEARVAEVADMIAGGARHASARAEARRLLGI